MKVRVSWGQQEGRGFWWVAPLEGEAFRASKVYITDGETFLNEEGERVIPGGPRGWIEANLVSFEPCLSGSLPQLHLTT